VALGTRTRRALIALGLAALVAGVYWPVRGHAWLNYDDDVYITANPNLTLGLSPGGVAWAFTTLHGANWFPLTWLSWMLDFDRSGLDPSGFHTTNLLLHAGATAVLFLALSRLTKDAGRSAFVAAVFGVHPLHVESVAWAAARKDPLSGLFFMLALLAYAAGGRHERRPLQMALVLLCLALGLLAKQTIVTLPFVLLLLDAWPLGRLGGTRGSEGWKPAAVRRAVLEKLPLFAWVAVMSAVATLAQRSAGVVADLEQLSVGARVGNAALACVAYLRKALLPTDLAVFYPHPGNAVPAAAAVAALALLALLTALSVRAARRHPALTVGWLWYLGTLVPVLGLVQVGSQAMADRYTYLPLVGLGIAVAWGVPELLGRTLRADGPRRAVLAVLGAACIVALATGARLQLRHWRDSEALMRHTLAVTDANYIAHAHLGSALLERGEVGQAIGHWTESARIRPGYPTVANNLAWLLATHPDPSHRNAAAAIEHAERAVRISGDDPAVFDTLAAAYASAQRFADAVETAERALGEARRRGDDALARDIAQRLALYRSRRPYVAD
jgi:tetratricopeptide (TPR) repeat protein